MGPIKKSVLDDLLSFINPKPVTVDSDNEFDAKVSKAENLYTSSDEDSGPLLSRGKKRSLDVSEFDERYAGKKKSRSKLGIGNDQDECRLRDSEQSASIENDSVLGNDSIGDSSDLASSGEGDENSDLEDENRNQDEQNENDSFQHISKQNLSEEVDKGKAVKHQLDMWDSLLECRIKFQKCLVSANCLPQYNVYKKVMHDHSPELKVATQNTSRLVSQLLTKLLELQNRALGLFTETLETQDGNAQYNLGKTICDVELLSSEEDDSVTPNQNSPIHQKAECSKAVHKLSTRNYDALLKDAHENYVAYRNATIQKWNDKTRVAVGNLSNKNFSAFEQSTVKQIEHILQDQQRLVQRTQMKRTNYEVIGQVGEGDERDVEVFDDGDWYQQLVRDLIERKCAGVSDPAQLGRQWLQLQKLRSKMKRKVDTRATKGRKVSYAVHRKLVSFMAPVAADVWSDAARSELYSSLFSNAAVL